MPSVMIDGVLRELWDDTTRIYTAWDESGVVVEQRPYTEQENAQADAAAAQAVADAAHAETSAAVSQIIDDLRVEMDKMQVVQDTPNATINANPAQYVKDVARSTKRVAAAAIDLAKFVKGQ